ncbi:MAG TPA: YggS family pyridoxal phosphate-dependent enzyme [bacterium]|nr:YggS family pyridoxal phosphate-dependent enzyme [bacterium]HOL35652.1 YggS family pyridoxal phosphate-dependent enzyme [bacterium]HPP09028.1 YggS family pyridoxal phosphate-dependent enzyme [bacterium]
MIRENIEKIMKEVPPDVVVIAATKTRSVEEIKQAIECGITHIGENYIQEAEKKFNEIGKIVTWHLIGHLQKNKVKKALQIFDIIETVDSFELAREISKHAKNMFSVLIEVNSAKEPQKSGVYPEQVEDLIKKISTLPNISVAGLMTMGPFVENPENIRPYFRLTKNLFDNLKNLSLPNVEMKILSMGMSDSWRIAIEEGATCIRIGTAIFGPRK